MEIMQNTADGDVVFHECQIGKGFKPLAQHGQVVLTAAGELRLLGTKGNVLDSAPLSECTAKNMALGLTLSLKMGDRSYKVSPGKGQRGPSVSGRKHTSALVALIGGGAV